MTQEALKLALEALQYVVTPSGGTRAHVWDSSEARLVADAYRALEKALAQHDSVQAKPEPEQDNTYGYALRLATAIWQKHYMKDAPKWKPFDDLMGVLTQIDNMTCGLIKEKPAEQEQEPVGKFAKFTDNIWREVTDGSAGVPLYTHPPQRTWVGLTDEEAMNVTRKEWHELLDFIYEYGTGSEGTEERVVAICKAIEAKLKELNT